MKKIVVGMLAHVDAGKTTLSEAMLYESGHLKKLGRVDNKDAFLDNDPLERERGITIFSKQAILCRNDMEITLLDTPGHVDFSAEMERTLQVLDYAVLVISGASGVQSHTRTLWKLLKRYAVPTFVFVTKMDQPGTDKAAILRELTDSLSMPCVDFAVRGDALWDACAMCDEVLMEEYLETGALSDTALQEAVAAQTLVPCCFGSGLKMEGVEELLSLLTRLTKMPDPAPQFSARVYKISRDAKGVRLTHMKITGGSLGVRDPLSYLSGDGQPMQEKVQGLRQYSGEKFTNLEYAEAGTVVCVTGLTATWAGQGLGDAGEGRAPLLEPVLSYRLVLPPETDAHSFLPKLRQLEQEDPQLRIVWLERLQEIHVQLMGEVQTEILCKLIEERFDVSVTVDEGHILYKETLCKPCEGVGHFEPLRHYAEVHLLLEPLPRGSGVQYCLDCSEDLLDRNWQRLILTHLIEKNHLGICIGAPMTDVRYTLKSGKAHPKHTEGGDFRQATYRALRQGFMTGGTRVLEPWYQFTLKLPMEYLGRAMSDIRAMQGSFLPPQTIETDSILSGEAPVACLRNYARDVAAYTHGQGQLSCTPAGYAPCHDAQRIIEEAQYDPLADLENTPDSVFCSHGAGVNIRWDQVPEFMHLESCLKPPKPQTPQRPRSFDMDEKELEAIMEREFGPIRRPEYSAPRVHPTLQDRTLPEVSKVQYYLIDGYNVIFAWDALHAVANYDLSLARKALIDILVNYKSFKSCELVLVFDGYRVADNPGTREFQDGVRIVYTPQGVTGDMYMEQLANDIGKNHHVTVVTSDALIQLSALRSGILRMSAHEFQQELIRTDDQIAAILRDLQRHPEAMHSLIIKKRKAHS